MFLLKKINRSVSIISLYCKRRSMSQHCSTFSVGFMELKPQSASICSVFVLVNVFGQANYKNKRIMGGLAQKISYNIL